MTAKTIKDYNNTKKIYKFKSFLFRKIMFIKFVYIALGLNLLNLVAVFATQKRLPPELPLFYGSSEGGQQLSTPLGLLTPGILATVLVLVNTVISILLNNDYLKKILTFTSFTISLLLLITIVKIISLVGVF